MGLGFGVGVDVGVPGLGVGFGVEVGLGLGLLLGLEIGFRSRRGSPASPAGPSCALELVQRDPGFEVGFRIRWCWCVGVVVGGWCWGWGWGWGSGVWVGLGFVLGLGLGLAWFGWVARAFCTLFSRSFVCHARMLLGFYVSCVLARGSRPPFPSTLPNPSLPMIMR